MLFPTKMKCLSLSLGENVDNGLESSTQQMPKDQSKDYEITVPFLLNGEQWRPGNDIYSQVSLFCLLFYCKMCKNWKALGEVNARFSSYHHFLYFCRVCYLKFT